MSILVLCVHQMSENELYASLTPKNSIFILKSRFLEILKKSIQIFPRKRNAHERFLVFFSRHIYQRNEISNIWSWTRR